MRAQFEARCAAVGMTGNLIMETGDVTRKIIERALLTDLVVLNVAHPPGAGLTSLGHGLRNIIWRCARPILAVPGRVTQFARAVLAYDGSPKSKEALFIAAYLAEIYRTHLTVFSVNDGNRVPANVQDYARAYLEMHEIEADFVMSRRPDRGAERSGARALDRSGLDGRLQHVGLGRGRHRQRGQYAAARSEVSVVDLPIM